MTAVSSEVARDAGQADGLTLIEEWDAGLRSTNPLSFPGYEAPEAADESVGTGLVDLDGTLAVAIVCRFTSSGGTMGAVAGERVVRAYERATELGLDVAAIVASGGARLQEGMVSLTQMARTVSAAAEHRAAGHLTAAVFRPHTTGGVYASWASLADLRAAEPGATIGFGGPRVVKQVTGSLPPVTSHTAESAYRNGLVDALVERHGQVAWLAQVLGQGAPRLALPPGRPVVSRRSTAHHGTSGWERVRFARAADRPSGLEWAAALTEGWRELRGASDVFRAGIADLGSQRVVVVAMDRHALGDAAARPGPQAYRLAQRAIDLAGRLGLPIVTLVDTPGAEPGPEAEADGIAAEIARTMLAMAQAPVPTVSLCVGEGGSGGAMALAHTDTMLMTSGAVFSVIGPEAGAVVLYRDAARAGGLADVFGLRSEDVHALGIADRVIDESAADLVAQVRETLVGALRAGPGTKRVARLRASTARALVGDVTARD